MEHKVELVGGNYIKHGTLMRVSETESYFTYGGNFPARVRVEGKGDFYVTMYGTGYDYVSVDAGAVSGGKGYYTYTDLDDDEIWTNWVVDGVSGTGVFTLVGGTGKWDSATGKIECSVSTVPHDNMDKESYVMVRGVGVINLV